MLFSLLVALFGPVVLALEDPVDTLIKRFAPTSYIGYELRDLSSNKVIMAKHSHRAFTPASTLKVATAAAAMLTLGPQYRYETSLWRRLNDQQSSSLKGDLWWKFSGDPSLQSHHVDAMVRSLKKRGIHTISGNVWIDVAQFSPTYYPWGWTEDSLPWYFFAPITTMMIDQNAGVLELQGASHFEQKLAAVLKNSAVPLKVRSHLKTVSDEASEHCRVTLNMPQWDHVTLAGCWPLSQSHARLRFAYRFPNQVAIEKIRQAFSKASIVIKGKIVMSHKRVPKGYQPIVVNYSKPIQDLISIMLKQSDNIIAESLLKTMGYRKEGEGSFMAGLRARSDALEQYTQMQWSEADLYDGSGGSNYNLVTPQQMNELMARLARDPKMKPLINGLPIAGFDGTLQYRMKHKDLKEHIRAKTGGMRHVTTLTGLLNSPSNHNYIFTLFVNHASNESREVRQLQESLCRYWRTHADEYKIASSKPYQHK